MESTATWNRSSNNLRSLRDAAVAALAEALARVANLTLASEATFAEREAALLEASNEAVRRCLESEMQRRADGFGQFLLIGGEMHRRHEPGEVEYHSLCGTLQVKRFTYRKMGVHNGPISVPLDLSCGIIERATPALAFSVAQGFADGPVRHYEKQLRAAHRAPPSRSTLERMARYIGGNAGREILVIEPILRAQEKVPAGAHALAIGLDRTTVPMAEERPPTQAPNTTRKRRTRPYVRKQPPPIDVCYRMAYVGTVTVVDHDGEALTTRRYHATHEEGPQEMLSRMMADVTHLRRQKELPIVVVQDGAPELWNLMRDALRGIGINKWQEVIDRYHLNERLAEVSALCERHAVDRQRHYEKWQECLDRNDRAIEAIEKYLWAELRRWNPNQRRAEWQEKLSAHHTYISLNHRQMRYASLRRAGLPIGSGVTEGACKSLVMMRAKRCGQRWQQDGLTAALLLRSLEQSDRLQPFWCYFQRLYNAEIKAAA